MDTTTISAVIIEDERPAARLLNRMLSNVRPAWSVTTLPGSVSEAVDWFANHPHPQILFLDIRLTDGDAFDFITQAQPDSAIIFTTAYEQFALRAFEVNGIDYLLKPFDEQRLEAAINKFERLDQHTPDQQEVYLQNILSALHNKEKAYRTRFLIEGLGQFRTLLVEDIAYFKSENKITYAVLKNGKEQFIDLPLDKLAEQLDPDKFFRLNRQFIASLHSINKLEPYFGGKLAVFLQPATPQAVIVSKEKANLFKLWLNY